MRTRSYIKTLWLAILIQCLVWPVFAQDASIKEAEVAYTKEDYATAIQLYEGLLKNNGESAAIYYNLGNAYYKNGQIAPAILNYERGLLLQPIGHFFLTDWFNAIRDLASADTWGTVGIICFLLFIICLVVFFFSKIRRFKQLGFYAALVLLLIVVFSNIFGFSQKNELENRQEAIVFAASTTVKSSPDVSGTDLVVLHEGTKVAVKSTLGEWSEVELALFG